MNEMEKAPQDLFQELSQFMELRGIRCIFEVGMQESLTAKPF